MKRILRRRKKLNLLEFRWDSEDQTKGYLSLLQWARAKNVKIEVSPQDLFFIQKDHDTHEYWREMVGNQVKMLQDEIFLLRQENVKIKEDIAKLGSSLSVFKTIVQTLARLLSSRKGK